MNHENSMHLHLSCKDKELRLHNKYYAAKWRNAHATECIHSIYMYNVCLSCNIYVHSNIYFIMQNSYQYYVWMERSYYVIEYVTLRTLQAQRYKQPLSLLRYKRIIKYCTPVRWATEQISL